MHGFPSKDASLSSERARGASLLELPNPSPQSTMSRAFAGLSNSTERLNSAGCAPLALNLRSFGRRILNRLRGREEEEATALTIPCEQQVAAQEANNLQLLRNYQLIPLKRCGEPETQMPWTEKLYLLTRFLVRDSILGSEQATLQKQANASAFTLSENGITTPSFIILNHFVHRIVTLFDVTAFELLSGSPDKKEAFLKDKHDLRMKILNSLLSDEDYYQCIHHPREQREQYQKEKIRLCVEAERAGESTDIQLRLSDIELPNWDKTRNMQYLKHFWDSAIKSSIYDNVRVTAEKFRPIQALSATPTERKEAQTLFSDKLKQFIDTSVSLHNMESENPVRDINGECLTIELVKRVLETVLSGYFRRLISTDISPPTT